jgi:hypothetical protein
LTGLHFGAAGSCVSPVGLDEARVRPSIREPEELERRQGEFDCEEPLRPRRGLPTSSPPQGATGRNRPPRGGLPNTTASGRGSLFRHGSSGRSMGPAAGGIHHRPGDSHD